MGKKEKSNDLVFRVVVVKIKKFLRFGLVLKWCHVVYDNQTLSKKLFHVCAIVEEGHGGLRNLSPAIIIMSMCWANMLHEIFHLIWFVVHLSGLRYSRKFLISKIIMELHDILLPLQLLIAFIFFVMSVVGNLFVIIVMLKKKTLRQTSANYYIIAIATVDFTSGAFAVPFFVYGVSVEQKCWTKKLCGKQKHESFLESSPQVLTRGPHNYTACIWMTSLIFVLFGISINLLVALSANRYWAVCHPTSYYTSKESGYKKWIILSAFSIGTLLGSFPALGWNSGKFDGNCYLVDLVSFSYLLLCCFWTLLSSLVIIVLYGFIYKALAKHVSLLTFLKKKHFFLWNTWILVKKSTRFVCWFPERKNSGVIATSQSNRRNQNNEDDVAGGGKFSTLLDANHDLLLSHSNYQVSRSLWLRESLNRTDFPRYFNHRHAFQLSHRSTHLRISDKGSSWRNSKAVQM